MTSLVIGKTSQLAQYFPDEFIKISSRNINFEDYKHQTFNRVYITFAEQRTFIDNNKKLFDDINFDLTLKVIDFFTKISNKVIVYSTFELWNKWSGGVNLNMDHNFFPTQYIKSKHKLIKTLQHLGYNNLIILYPTNFNSVYRKEGFLFYKIFNSIINKKPIIIGDTYTYRDIIHPKYVVERSILTESDEIVGSGRLTFVNDFIRRLYSYFKLDYNVMVTENISNNLSNKRNIYYLDSKEQCYDNLFEDTIADIKHVISNKDPDSILEDV